MSSEKKVEESLEDLEKKKKRMKILYGLIAFVIVVDIFAPRHHPHFFWDYVPGASSVLGFISVLILIFFSKGLGHAYLMKREDFYDD